MNLKIEIDPETADGIVRCSLKQTIAYLREDIAKLKKTKKLESYQKVDLADFTVALEAMEVVHDYYGGNMK